MPPSPVKSRAISSTQRGPSGSDGSDGLRRASSSHASNSWTARIIAALCAFAFAALRRGAIAGQRRPADRQARPGGANFSRTVVLVTQAESGETVGVILNRPTQRTEPRTGAVLYLRRSGDARSAGRGVPLGAAACRARLPRAAQRLPVDAPGRISSSCSRASARLPAVFRLLRLGAEPARVRDAARWLVRAAGDRGADIPRQPRGNVGRAGGKGARQPHRFQTYSTLQTSK